MGISSRQIIRKASVERKFVDPLSNNTDKVMPGKHQARKSRVEQVKIALSETKCRKLIIGD